MSIESAKPSEIKTLAQEISTAYLNAVSTTYRSLTDSWNQVSTSVAEQRAQALQAFEQDFRRMATLTEQFSDSARNAGSVAQANVAQTISNHFAQKANALLDPVVSVGQK